MKNTGNTIGNPPRWAEKLLESLSSPLHPASSYRSGTMMSNLIHRIGHEVGNPLTSIISLASLLERVLGDISSGKLPADSPQGAKLPSYLQSLLAEAWKVNSLNQRMVALFSERAPTECETDLPTVIARVINKLAPNDPAVVLDLPDTMLVAVESDQLELLLRESFENALEASGSCQSDPHYRKLHVVVWNEGEDAELLIVNSCRRSQLDSAKLFEPLVSEHRESRRLGIGLSLAHTIAERHHGRLRAGYASHDEGTLFCFCCTLPLISGARAVVPVRELPTTADQRETEALSVLLIEDDHEVASSIKKILELALPGCSVVCANFEESTTLLGSAHFDAILSDVAMGKAGGRAILREVETKAPELLSHLGFITGDRSKFDRDSVLSRSGAPCLQKPFSPETLIGFVTQLARGT